MNITRKKLVVIVLLLFNNLKKALNLSRSILSSVVSSTWTSLLLLTTNIGDWICRLVVDVHRFSSTRKNDTIFFRKLTRVSKSPPTKNSWRNKKKVSHISFFFDPPAKSCKKGQSMCTPFMHTQFLRTLANVKRNRVYTTPFMYV